LNLEELLATISTTFTIRESGSNFGNNDSTMLITIGLPGRAPAITTGALFYNQYRSGIATLFPDYSNCGGAVGFFRILH